MAHTIRKSPSALLVLLILLYLATIARTGDAISFPFRAIAVGDVLPSVTLTDLASRKEVSLNQFKGQPLVVLFWGADLPSKRQRSLDALRDLERLKGFFREKTVAVLLVNVQGDSAEVIEGVMAESEATFPAYLDPSRKAYSTLGIFVTPSLLVTDKAGRVAAGMGYGYSLVERLKAEVEVVLDEKSRADAQEALHPEMAQEGEGQKGAKRHLHMGIVMLDRGMPDAAERELKEAARLDPTLGAAQVELGCLYLEGGQLAQAEQALGAGLKAEPESLRGQVCSARLKVLKGAEEEAEADLQGLLLRAPGEPDVHYVLGMIHEKQGLMDRAAQEYRKAYDLLHNRKEQR